jgi:hypothetical protein
MKRFLTICAASLAVTFVCAGAYASAKADSPALAPQGQPAVKSLKADSLLSGKVVETMNAGGYTYVCIEKKGKKTWVAVPEMKVVVGQKMGFQPGMEMTNFTSKSLNRTFERIIFSSGPLVKTEADKPAFENHGGGKAAAASSGEKISVEKAVGENAYTVAEIFANKASLNSKTVILRGKVVKVSSGIMGKNWIHLQDGTGDAQKGTHDLVATSQDSPAIGDVVTVKGTIYRDKDFGAGYRYDVIMEEASLQR